jgi:hypothetical protein
MLAQQLSDEFDLNPPEPFRALLSASMIGWPALSVTTRTR